MRDWNYAYVVVVGILFVAWLALPGSIFEFGPFFVRNIISASLSATVCYSYLRFSDLRSNGFKLVFFLAMCDFLLSMLFMVITLVGQDSV